MLVFVQMQLFYIEGLKKKKTCVEIKQLVKGKQALIIIVIIKEIKSDLNIP